MERDTYVCVQDRRVARAAWVEGHGLRCPVCRQPMIPVRRAPRAKDTAAWARLGRAIRAGESGHMTPRDFREAYVWPTVPPHQKPRARREFRRTKLL